MVNILEYNFYNLGNIIYLVWIRVGGGYYELVIENLVLKEYIVLIGLL